MYNPIVEEECIQLLKEALMEEDLSEYERRKVRKVFLWANNESKGGLTIIDLLAVVRIVGGELVVKLDHVYNQYFLQYDTATSRITLIDPSENYGTSDGSGTPIEEIPNFQEIHQEANAITLVTRDGISEKEYTVISVARRDGEENKLLFGDYSGTVSLITKEGMTKSFELKFQFALPEPMTPQEIRQRLLDDEVDVSKIAQWDQASGLEEIEREDLV